MYKENQRQSVSESKEAIRGGAVVLKDIEPDLKGFLQAKGETF
jgi:hypothetical protein